MTSYEANLGALVGDERYIQKPKWNGQFVTIDGSAPRKKQQQTESAFLIMPVAREWIGVRDVSCVDGVLVKGRAQEFLKTFNNLSEPDFLETVKRISNESTIYNIGVIQRTTNLPTFALRVLRPGMMERFEFVKSEAGSVGGVRTIAVTFREIKGPSMIHDLENQDEFASGTLWIEPATGRILQTEINVAEHNWRAAFRARTTVTYEENPKLGMLSPVTMLEHYETDFGYTLDCRADYTNFRRPGADVKLNFGPVPTNRPNPQ